MILNELRSVTKIGELPIERLTKEIFENDAIKRIYFLSPVACELLRRSTVAFRPDALLIDAMSLAMTLNWRWGTRLRRYSFDNGSISPWIYRYAADNGKSIAIIGATEVENRIYCERLTAEYPAINIVMAQHGFLQSAEKDQVILQLSDLQPDIIIVGMGSPAQEAFGNAIHLAPGQKLFTCGAHITQSARDWDYYPTLVNKLHLRWLYRLAVEPHTRKRVPKIFAGLLHAWRTAHG